MMLILFIIRVKINIFFGQGNANITGLVLQVWYKQNVEQGILERKHTEEENVTFWNKSGVRLGVRLLFLASSFSVQHTGVHKGAIRESVRVL